MWNIDLLIYLFSQLSVNKGNNKITEHRAIFQSESQTHKSTKEKISQQLEKPQWP